LPLQLTCLDPRLGHLDLGSSAHLSSSSRRLPRSHIVLEYRILHFRLLLHVLTVVLRGGAAPLGRAGNRSGGAGVRRGGCRGLRRPSWCLRASIRLARCLLGATSCSADALLARARALVRRRGLASSSRLPLDRFGTR
ncbi:hypothetical protein PMAYCL1PPCAC_28104, partial [Pristionchus mayeri]